MCEKAARRALVLRVDEHAHVRLEGGRERLGRVHGVRDDLEHVHDRHLVFLAHERLEVEDVLQGFEEQRDRQCRRGFLQHPHEVVSAALGKSGDCGARETYRVSSENLAHRCWPIAQDSGYTDECSSSKVVRTRRNHAKRRDTLSSWPAYDNERCATPTVSHALRPWT